MRAMGIDIKKKIKIKGTDYNAEIPFQRNAPYGRFEPDKNQTPIPDENTANIAMQQLSQSRRDVTQKKKRQMDIKKFEMLKEQNYEAANAKIKKLREQKMIQSQQSRTQLKLPAAVINENQFSEIQKLTNSSDGENLSSMLQLGNLSVNRDSNVQSYARTPSNLKDLLSEAKNSYLLMNAPTPLLAGIDEKASYQAFMLQNTLQKSSHQLKTTNPLLTSVQRAKEEKGIFKEPLPINRDLSQKQQKLLMLDQSQIDRQWDESIDNKVVQNKQCMIKDIISSISSLPQPKNKQIAPTFQQNLVNNQIQQSSKDIIQLIHNDQLSYKDVPLSLDQIVTQTLSKKSDLPIPKHSLSQIKFNEEIDMTQKNQLFNKEIEQITNLHDPQNNSFSKLILKECDRLILGDQQQSTSEFLSQDLNQQITKQQYKQAENLINEQIDRQEYHKLSKMSGEIKYNYYYMYFPSFDFISKPNEKTISNAEKFQAYQQMLKRKQDCNKRMLKKIDNLQTKLNKKLGSFYKREVGLRENIQKNVKKYQKLRRDIKLFEILQKEEDKAGAQRISQEKLFLNRLRLKEEALQKKYIDFNSKLL